jgi:hypothetical protein
MSSPGGSDLAAARTRATRVAGGLARERDEGLDERREESDWFVVLCRTGGLQDRHAYQPADR